MSKLYRFFLMLFLSLMGISWSPVHGTNNELIERITTYVDGVSPEELEEKFQIFDNASLHKNSPTDSLFSSYTIDNLKHLIILTEYMIERKSSDLLQHFFRMRAEHDVAPSIITILIYINQHFPTNPLMPLIAQEFRDLLVKVLYQPSLVINENSDIASEDLVSIFHHKDLKHIFWSEALISRADGLLHNPPQKLLAHLKSPKSSGGLFTAFLGLSFDCLSKDEIKDFGSDINDLLPKTYNNKTLLFNEIPKDIFKERIVYLFSFYPNCLNDDSYLGFKCTSLMPIVFSSNDVDFIDLIVKCSYINQDHLKTEIWKQITCMLTRRVLPEYFEHYLKHIYYLLTSIDFTSIELDRIYSWFYHDPTSFPYDFNNKDISYTIQGNIPFLLNMFVTTNAHLLKNYSHLGSSLEKIQTELSTRGVIERGRIDSNFVFIGNAPYSNSKDFLHYIRL